MLPDELHAAYSKNLANQSVQKGLIKFAKDRGLASPEVWRHNGSWALRYTGTDGEVHNLSLGNVFAKARSVIASILSGDTTITVGKSYVFKASGKQVKVTGTSKDASAGGIMTHWVEYTGGRMKMSVFKAKVVAPENYQRRGATMSLAEPAVALEASTTDSKGQTITEGDKVKIGARYGGGTSIVKRVMNGFVVLANGKSYHGSDVTVMGGMSHPLDRLNALSLAKVIYHAGYYMCAGKRIGKTEHEAAEKIGAIR